MAIPGTWVLGGMVPSMAMTSLPAFYGLEKEATLELMDGKLGQAINENAEDLMRVKVLGPWMNLGFSHYFSTEAPLKSQEDLTGLRVRISGGTANAIRVRAFGGVANVVAWPDVPLALSTNVVDGMSSTFESIASAQLWDSGLTYALEDQQWFAQYVPMVSKHYWDDLSKEHQQAMLGAWSEVIDGARSLAAEAQSDARKKVSEQGIEIVAPSQEELAQWRQKLMPYQDQLVSELNIDPEMVEMAMQSLREAGHAK
jgi:C4-dicarboxylate-binding protein DctP